MRLIIKRKPLARPACERTIICNNGMGCGRRSCPAKTLSINTYVRRLKEVM